MIIRAVITAFVCVAAAEAQQQLSLADAVDTALSTHPEIASARARLSQFEGARKQAGFAPNPQLTIQSENIRRSTSNNPFSFSQQTDNFVSLQQQFEPGGKRSRRVDAAEAAIAVAGQELASARLSVAAAVKDAYWAAAGAQQTLDLLEATKKNFQQIVEYHEIRVREGAMAESDLLRVRLEADRIELASNQARLDAQRTRINLLRAMGQSAFPETELTTGLEARQDTPIVPDPDAALARRPDMLAARAGVDAARAGLRLQRANARTDYSLFFGYKRTEGFNTMMGGVQWDRSCNRPSE